MPARKVVTPDVVPVHCLCDRETGLTVGYALHDDDGWRICHVNPGLEYMSYWELDPDLPIFTWVEHTKHHRCCYL